MKEKSLLFIALLILAFGILLLASVSLFSATGSLIPTSCIAEPGYLCGDLHLIQNGTLNATLNFQFGEALGYNFYNTTIYVLSGSKFTKQNITASKFLGAFCSGTDQIGVYNCTSSSKQVSIANVPVVSPGLSGVLWVTANGGANGTTPVSEKVAAFSTRLIITKPSMSISLIGLVLVFVAIIMFLYVYRRNRGKSK